MNTARRANLEGAIIGNLAVLVRGEAHFTIPARELADLVALVHELTASAGAVAPAPVAARAATAPAAAVAAPAPVAPQAAVPIPASVAVSTTEAPKAVATPRGARAVSLGTQRRGRVWEGIKALISAEGPQTLDALCQMVVDQGLTDRNVDHAVKIAVGKKVSAGELVDYGSGIFGLAGGAAPSEALTSAVTPVEAPVKRKVGRPRKSESVAKADEPPPVKRKVGRPPKTDKAPPAPKRKVGRPPKTDKFADKKRHRPGALWASMRAHMEAHPGGLTFDQLVATAGSEAWTTATDPSHAVKICLTRVRDQLERTYDGGYRLKGAAPVVVATATPAPTVRRRRKAIEPEPMVETAAVVEPVAEPEAPRSDDPDFEASRFYPKRRGGRASA